MNEPGSTPPITEDQLGPDGDTMYAALLQAHSDLNDEQSVRLNARLVLLLMNQLADPDKFDQVLNAAKSIALNSKSNQ